MEDSTNLVKCSICEEIYCAHCGHFDCQYELVPAIFSPTGTGGYTIVTTGTVHPQFFVKQKKKFSH